MEGSTGTPCCMFSCRNPAFILGTCTKKALPLLKVDFLESQTLQQTIDCGNSILLRGSQNAV